MSADWEDVPLPGLDKVDTGVIVAPICQGHVQACRDCAAPIVWAMTGQRRPMPVNANTDPTGTLQLETVRGGLRCTVPPAPERAGRTDLHLSHFATCPKANERRKPATRRRPPNGPTHR